MPKKPKLALIDAHALIHRAYHALPPMSAAGGLPTNAAFGFTTTLLKVFTTLKPTHVVAAFDVKGPTFRTKEFADYKAHRQAAAADLISQFDLVQRIVRAFNIPIVSKPGFEADDIIGTLVETIDGSVKKIIVTGDLDTLQLVNDSTSVFTLKRGVADTIIYTPQTVREKYGFGPEVIPDYKGLKGDPSDNIPGVAGIGEKSALALVSRYGSLENIFQNLAALPERLQKKLAGKKSAAAFSRRLATIRRDVPIKFSLSAAELADYNVAQVRAIFEELEFRSLIGKLPPSRHGGLQPSLFAQPSPRPNQAAAEINLPPHYHLAATPAAQAKLRARLRQAKLIAFDTETDALGARLHPIVGMSFALPAGALAKAEAWYVPITPKELPAWGEILANPAIQKVGHNLKYDLAVARASGVELAGITFDSMLASYLLRPGARAHDLDSLAVQELNYHPIPITDLIGSGKEQKKMSAVPLPALARYAAEDAEVALKLYEVLAPQIKEQGLTRVMAELEVPLIPVLADIELTGITLDTSILRQLQKKVAKRLLTLTEAIWQAAGSRFNINSSSQLRVVLYERLKLPTQGIARTQSGFSTAAAELDKLRGAHPIIELLAEYRELAKLQNTYIETLPGLVDKKTGRLYASFNQTVAATGRLSSSDPNLQNIPVRTAVGQEIRAAFIAPRGRRLVKADYSQLELRLAAHLSGDERLIDAFRAGKDIHVSTAAWVYGLPEDQVTLPQRRQAKTLNFGVLYGMGAGSFARAAGVSPEQARSFIGRYQQQYPGLMEYIDITLRLAKEQGYVATLFGRRRPMPEINSAAPAIRAAAQRAAFNFPIQGTAADILKKAMIALHAFLRQQHPAAHIVLTVHDELVVESPAKDAPAIARAMKKIMESVITLDVPLIVDVAVGQDWKNMQLVK